MSAGRERFLRSVADFRVKRLPEVSKAYQSLPAGYRTMLARQAGLTSEEALLPLHELSNDRRKRLFDANRKLDALCTKAYKVLLSAIIPGL